MKTLLLLAGRSKRFWPLADKNLVPIAGKTLLEHQVERLRAGGCRDITLVIGPHNMKEVKKLFPDLPVVRQQDLDLGMQGAMVSALPKVKKEPVLVVSGNDVIEPEAYRALVEASTKKGVDGAILARKVKRYFPGGYLTVKGGRIRGIVEKPGEGKEPSKLVNIVAHVHNNPAALLATLKGMKSGRDDGYERALDALFQEKKYVAVPYEGVWQPVKYPWHLLPLLELFLKEIKEPRVSKKAQIHPSAVVTGNVVIEDGVRLLPGACVVGPCFIGKDTVIGNGALVRGASVGERCVIGFQSEVKASVLFSDIWTHMTYIGDSVVAENVSFGGGTTTGNFRLDEEEVTSKVGADTVQTGLTKLGAIIGRDCRLGIHVGTNPGVKIGEGSFIAGGTFLHEDVPAKSFARVKEGKLIIRENRVAAPGAEERTKYRR
jgi:bifunctional UDP-N-acetylglucosamine pyrophosphorylase/glucosamine-1-phosphate N-acetyltransferase